MASTKEGQPLRVSVPTAPNLELPRNGNHNPEAEKALSVVQRRDLVHAGRVLGRIENGHDTKPVRHEVETLFKEGRISETGQIGQKLLQDLTKSWRRISDSGAFLEDDQLDTSYSPPKTPKNNKAA